MTNFVQYKKVKCIFAPETLYKINRCVNNVVHLSVLTDEN